MDLLNALLRSGGFEGLARHTATSSMLVSDVAGVLIPDLFEAMRRYVRGHGGGSGGVDALMALIDELGDGEMVAAILSQDPVDIAPGKALLARLYPDRATLDVAIGRTAFDSGQDRELVSRMAPYAAMLLAGYLGARSSSGTTTHEEALGPIHTALTSREPSGPAD